MPSGTQRRAAAKHAKGARRPLGPLGHAARVGLEEAAGIESVGVGAEEGRVVVDGGAGHLDDGVFGEEVIADDGVGEDFADGGVGGIEAHGFLVDGDEEGAVGAEFGDVDEVGGRVGVGRGGGDDGFDLGAQVVQEAGPREDVQDDPEGGGDDVGEDGEEEGGFAPGDVLEL